MKADWGGLAALDGLPLLAAGIALGAAAVLAAALFTKLLKPDLEA